MVLKGNGRYGNKSYRPSKWQHADTGDSDYLELIALGSSELSYLRAEGKLWRG